MLAPGSMQNVLRLQHGVFPQNRLKAAVRCGTASVTLVSLLPLAALRTKVCSAEKNVAHDCTHRKAFPKTNLWCNFALNFFGDNFRCGG